MAISMRNTWKNDDHPCEYIPWALVPISKEIQCEPTFHTNQGRRQCREDRHVRARQSLALGPHWSYCFARDETHLK